MNINDATEVAYTNGYETGRADATRDILDAIKDKLQRASFSDIKDRFVLLDVLKRFEQHIEHYEGEMHIRVPYAMKLGQKVYMILDKKYTDDGKYGISEETVTDISKRGFFISGHNPAEDDHGEFIEWRKVGVEAFLTPSEADAEIKRREKREHMML